MTLAPDSSMKTRRSGSMERMSSHQSRRCSSFRSAAPGDLFFGSTPACESPGSWWRDRGERRGIAPTADSGRPESPMDARPVVPREPPRRLGGWWGCGWDEATAKGFRAVVAARRAKRAWSVKLPAHLVWLFIHLVRRPDGIRLFLVCAGRDVNSATLASSSRDARRAVGDGGRGGAITWEPLTSQQLLAP